VSRKLTQVVALVTYGNLHLQNRSDEFNLDRMIADNCYRIDFIDRPTDEIAGSAKVIAQDVERWFKYLKKNDAVKLRLHYHTASISDMPDHISTAFVGGGSHWLIEVQFENHSDLYLSEWIPSDDWQLDTRKTHYVRFETSIPHLEEILTPVDQARKELGDLLRDLSEFAAKFEHSASWADYFDNSRKTLNDFEHQSSDDFLPAGIYSKEAHHLIQAGFGSWCFGGMGSWNDLSFSGEDQKRYHQLSEKLYTTLCGSLVAGVNSYPS
jgi:hypothetical protein